MRRGEDYHSLLRRQIVRCFGADGPPESLARFLSLVDDAYRQADSDREMLERSLDLSSQELLDANTDLRAVLDDVLDLLLRVDDAGVVVDVRAGKNSTFAIQPRDLIGRHVNDLGLHAPATDLARVLARVRRDRSYEVLEAQFGELGNERDIEMHVLPQHNDQAIIVLIDVTAERQVASRERQLQMRLARFERMESLGVLAGGVAHDLNNLLGPLVAYPELISMQLPAEHPAQESLRVMAESVGRAVGVIRDLLALAGRGSHDAEAIAFNDAIDSHLSSPNVLALRAKQPEVTLQVGLAEGLPPVRTSAHRLGQVIMNLLHNAFESIEGPGQIVVSTTRAQLGEPRRGFETIMPGDYVMLRVQDTGIGIAAAHIEHIFEPFYSNKKLGRSGSGLGLAVVYGVTKDAAGFLDVRSAPGRGTTLDLYFPTSDDAILRRDADTGRIAGDETVLVVDDVEEQRAVVRRILEPVGYTVLEAEHGRAAVALLRERNVDLVVLDMIMEPDFDGLTTFRTIRRLHPQQAVILATGYAATDRVKEAQRRGAGACLSKPFTPAELRRAVRTALDQAGTISPR